VAHTITHRRICSSSASIISRHKSMSAKDDPASWNVVTLAECLGLREARHAAQIGWRRGSAHRRQQFDSLLP